MFNFFADDGARQGNCFYISGPDYNHIKNVLRMKVDDEFLVSENGTLPEASHNGDGIHLSGETFGIVMQYIRTHAYN